MKITAIKTPLVKKNDDLKKIIADSIKSLPEKSVLAIASKIVAYSQGRLIPKDMSLDEKAQRAEKQAIVRREADFYLEPNESKYDLMVTINKQIIAVNAGLDESNAANNSYVLWPENMQETANDIWQFLRDHYGVKEVGVIFTDSRTIPLRWGVVGTCLVHSGFKALHNYIGDKDLFGREMLMEQVAMAEGIASAVVLEMGEVAERTPLAIVEDIKLIEFQDRVPITEELEALFIDIKDDVYEPFLGKAEWRVGGIW